MSLKIRKWFDAQISRYLRIRRSIQRSTLSEEWIPRQKEEMERFFTPYLEIIFQSIKTQVTLIEWYSIVAQFFSNIIWFSGVIKLREPLDREERELIDVVVTIQDFNYENIVPYRRRIKGIDWFFQISSDQFVKWCNFYSSGRQWQPARVSRVKRVPVFDQGDGRSWRDPVHVGSCKGPWCRRQRGRRHFLRRQQIPRSLCRLRGRDEARHKSWLLRRPGEAQESFGLWDEV